jgi:glycine oxidase
MSQIIIIGGGVLGMLSALTLRQRGFEVCLLERGKTGQESSWAGGGILSPLHPWRYPNEITALADWGQQHYAHLVQTLHNDTGIDSELCPTGLLIVNSEEQKQAQTWASQHDYTIHTLHGKTIQQKEPRLATHTTKQAALWLPNITHVRNPRFVRALHSALKLAGVTIHEDSEVLQIKKKKQGFSVHTASAQYHSEQIVIAAGAWSAHVLDTLQDKTASVDLKIAVEPVRGQMILFKTQPNWLSRIVLAENRYLIPRRDGRILVGSTLEYTGFNKQTTATALAELKQVAYDLVPDLIQFPIEHHWAGLRPSSPNSVPYIGEHPNISGLYINTGHFRNGVVLGYASCYLLADLMSQQTPIVDPEPYALMAARAGTCLF